MPRRKTNLSRHTRQAYAAKLKRSLKKLEMQLVKDQQRFYESLRTQSFTNGMLQFIKKENEDILTELKSFAINNEREDKLSESATVVTKREWEVSLSESNTIEIKIERGNMYDSQSEAS